MRLFFDTETTGLPDFRMPPGDESQPHLVQLACLLLDADGQERAAVSLVVYPRVPIPPEASRVHGITNALASRCGVSPETAVAVFCDLLAAADLVVAHNVKFDVQVMKSALTRAGRPADSLSRMSKACTMEAASPVVNLPPTARMLAAGYSKPKPPRLSECVQHFFGEDLDGAHDAMVDVRACARVFHLLNELGKI